MNEDPAYHAFGGFSSAKTILIAVWAISSFLHAKGQTGHILDAENIKAIERQIASEIPEADF